MFTSKTAARLAAFAVLVCSILTTQATIHAAPLVLLQDDFDDNSLDLSKWSIGNGTVNEQNQRIELNNRGYLNTVNQYRPLDAAIGGLTITGEWTFAAGDAEFFQVLTRSDGTPAGGFAETNAGIEFQAITGGNMQIIRRAGAGSNPLDSGGGATALPGGMTIGDTFDFMIMDDGLNVSLTLTEQGNPGNTATVIGTEDFDPATNLITFHNREGNRTAYLDDVLVVSKTLAATPEPSTFVLFAIGMVTLCTRRRRRNRR